MKNEKKFHTDSIYYTKEDFVDLKEEDKKGYSWQEVKEYRDKFTFEIPLLDEKGNNVKLTQTPWILQKEIRLISSFSHQQASMLTDLSSRYASATLLSDISMKSFVNEMHWLLNNKTDDNTIVSRTVIEHLVNKTDEPVTPDDKKILELYEKFETITSKLTTPREVAKLFFNKTINSNEAYEDVNSSIVETLRSDKIYSILTKAAALVYGILSTKMYGDKSYEIMVLSLISVSRNSYKGEILKGVSFFKTLEYFKADLYKAVEDAKLYNSDLTFVTLKLIDILMYSLRLSIEQIETFIKDEERYNSLTTKDKNQSYKAILSMHPELSVKQAKFYVNYCDPKINYTLKDFQEYFGSSYETSRYSLVKLVELGFYKKKKIGKKFVYNAIKQK